MIRYGLSAFALKAFSLNSGTRRLYRHIGNVLGGKRRENTDLDIYMERGELLLDLYRRYDRLRPGDHLLELGTGWMHFFAVYLRLFIDVKITTLDVWDDRQFGAFKSCFSRLRPKLMEHNVAPQVIATLDRVLQAHSFEEAYDTLSFKHVIVPDGALHQFPDASLDSVFSMHVLEHVPRESVPELARSIYRVLKPGRLTVHQIGIDDHLTHYDASMSEKQYITYSNSVWGMFFQNRVQYFNRLQMSDWIREFQQAGLVMLDKIAVATSLDGLNVSADFAHYPPEDLACTNLTMVFQKPDK